MRQLQLFQAVHKGMSKVIHFQKFPKIRNTDGRVLLSVKFQTLLYKNESIKGVFLETFRKFPEHLGIINFRY